MYDGFNKTDIKAAHATHVEHKIVFYIDGQKYGFRCDEQYLEGLKINEGEVIPMVSDWQGITRN